MNSFTDKSGKTIRFHDLEGDLTPILFIHGLGCSSSFDYPEVANCGFINNHRRILIDLLGYGFSDKGSEVDFSFEGQASVLLDLIEYLQLESVILYGHSMGGTLAIILAVKMQALVRALIISEGNLDPGGGAGSRSIAAYSLENYIKTGHREIISQNKKEGNGSWASTMEISSPIAVHQGASELVLGSSPSWREMLYSFSFPITYIFGERSLPDADVDILEKKGIQIGIVPNAGHNMASENPNGLAEAISVGIFT